MRYIIEGQKESLPYCHYVGNCVPTHRGEKATVWTSLIEAQAEILYWRRVCPAYRWNVAQLPPRVPLSVATLRSKRVDL